jgi:hypothetical protein
MSVRKYKFVTPSSQSIYDDIPLDNIKFYQICAFPNPKIGKFEIREVLIDGNNEIKSYRILNINEKTQRKLLRALRDNKYRLYSTFTMAQIEMPSFNDISLARSGMLNNDNNYSGFAEFDSSHTGDFNWRGIVP